MNVYTKQRSERHKNSAKLSVRFRGIRKSEFHFLPSKINFVTPFTQFNWNSLRLPHLRYFIPHFTPLIYFWCSGRWVLAPVWRGYAKLDAVISWAGCSTRVEPDHPLPLSSFRSPRARHLAAMARSWHQMKLRQQGEVLSGCSVGVTFGSWPYRRWSECLALASYSWSTRHRR
jgi:hypothetical protein